MSRISIKGVLVGAIAGTVVCLLLAVLVAVLVVLVSHVTHTPREVFHRHGFLYLAMYIIGLACCILAGFVAALVSRHDELLNAGLSMLFCVLLTIFQIFRGRDPHPLMVQMIPIVAIPALAVLGGYRRLRQKRLRVRPA